MMLRNFLLQNCKFLKNLGRQPGRQPRRSHLEGSLGVVNRVGQLHSQSEFSLREKAEEDKYFETLKTI